jgi:hypothetical protein
VADRSNSEAAVNDDIERIKRTGEPAVGPDGKTSLDRAAASLTPNEFAKTKATWEKAKLEYSAISPLKGMTPEDAEAHIEKFIPSESTTGESYKAMWDIHDRAQKEWDKIEALRTKDPALAVNSDPAVKQAYQESKATRQVQLLDGTVTQQPAMDPQEAHRHVMDARIAAQARVGIPPDQRTVITRDEAKTLLGFSKATDLDPGQLVDKLKEASDRAESLYGKDGGYAVRAMQNAVGFMIRNNEQRLIAEDAIVKLARGENFVQDDLRKLQQSRGMAPLGRFLDSVNGNTAQPSPSLQPQGGTAAARPGSYSGPLLAAPGNAPGGGVQVPQKVVDWLRANPGGAEAVDRQFGAGAAARALMPMTGGAGQ